ncbi:hypothetical protein HYV22_04270 [Candidatus Gottesmanbacteria bacterium]|nr:hypothetical protein [Candidatus Gottesmanbacteria bacterium]
MELPQVLGHFVHAKEEKKELFLSLLLGIDGVIASSWQVSEKRLPVVVGVSQKDAASDSWDERFAAADQAISSLESANLSLNKVIFGLPASYLTETGDIQKTVRPYLKKLTHSLALSPMGFVSIHQAIVHHLKYHEGVPPTVILLGIAGSTITVSVYKIGSSVGQKYIEKAGDVVTQLEEVLQSFTELEVLPSRILLYGIHHDHLEEVKRELLRHPWQTAANFMHFPKIDVLPQDSLIGAVSLVGASELATSLGPEQEEVVAEAVVQEKQKEELKEESNVVFVDPTRLGFKRSVDVREERSTAREEQRKKEPLQGEEIPQKQVRGISLPTFPSLPFDRLGSFIPRLLVSSRYLAAIGVTIAIVVLLWGFYWFVPRVSVTVYEVPKKLTKTMDIAVDSTATVPDSTSKILPGKKQEKSIPGEKTIAVTGKKQVGDPAKGAVAITNRTFNSITLPKGTVLTSGDLQFTLDNAVSIASASAFDLTKNTGSITAGVIGAKSNLSSGTTFIVKGYELSEVAAKNDKELSGGTSRDVTVVTRLDQDSLIKSLTKELVEGAKQELSGSVGMGDQLIDETIKTTVTDKSFVEELDQEASNLHGKATIAVSGISYSKSDLSAFLESAVASDIPSGYVFDPKYTTATLRDIEVKKDGKVTASVQFEGTATPQLDLVAIRRSLSGKTIVGAQEYLKTIPGVGAVSFRFQIQLLKGRLPVNANNITISVAVQE